MIRTKVVLIEFLDVVRHSFIFYLESKFNFEVIDFSSVQPKEISTLLSHEKNVQMIISDHSPSNNAVELFSHLIDNGLSIPFLCTNGDHEEIQSFKGHRNRLMSEMFPKDQMIDVLGRVVGDKFKIDENAGKLDFTPISIRTLYIFSGLEDALFIELPTGRKLKLFSKGDVITKEDMTKYENKGVKFLYLEKEASKLVLKELEKNFASVVSGDADIPIDVSIDSKSSDGMGEGTAEDIYGDGAQTGNSEAGGEMDYELPQKKIYGQQGASKDTGTAVEDVSGKKLQEQIEALEKIKKESEAKIEDVFKFEKKFLTQVKQRTEKLVKQLMKNKKMFESLKNLKVDHEDSKYIQCRIDLICQISISLAKDLKWDSVTTYEKFIYAAHTHDITLFKFPFLARVRNLRDLEEIKPTDQERSLYKAHINDSLRLIHDDQDAPKDVEKIIKEHHEYPDRSGFPKCMNAQRISPFSAIFIVALDLAEYALDTPDWDIKTYLESRKLKFRGGTFTKIYVSLSKVLSDK